MRVVELDLPRWAGSARLFGSNHSQISREAVAALEDSNPGEFSRHGELSDAHGLEEGGTRTPSPAPEGAGGGFSGLEEELEAEGGERRFSDAHIDRVLERSISASAEVTDDSGGLEPPLYAVGDEFVSTKSVPIVEDMEGGVLRDLATTAPGDPPRKPVHCSYLMAGRLIMVLGIVALCFLIIPLLWGWLGIDY